jgi:hypothetical protein
MSEAIIDQVEEFTEVSDEVLERVGTDKLLPGTTEIKCD